MIFIELISILADTAFSLILGPDRYRDLRGKFCSDKLSQNLKPLKYYIRDMCKQLMIKS
jgi:hypothetical protein